MQIVLNDRMFFNFSKNQKKEVSSLSEKDKMIMVSSLLIECAQSDDEFSDHEKDLIKSIIIKKTKIPDMEVEKIFNEALKITKENVEIYSLTKEIRENFSKDEILNVFQYLWQIIISDGHIDDYEASLMTKLTGLFHLTGKESANAKQKARELFNQNKS
ncbi:MAG: TerB family tellurite resistance protein [Pseudomonadota bacterium]|nr:TerB family tellurite resistance protein [Pseudomonadota bacterium]